MKQAINEELESLIKTRNKILEEGAKNYTAIKKAEINDNILLNKLLDTVLDFYYVKTKPLKDQIAILNVILDESGEKE